MGVAQPAARTRRFDVFLSHNSRDKPLVERVALRLRQAGVEPWLDSWNLTPGGRWQLELQEGLESSSACAVFVGPNGIGDWVREEASVAIDRAAKNPDFRTFLVLLPGLPERFVPTDLPVFLSTRTWVDLREGVESSRGIQALINAVRGVPIGPSAPAEPVPGVCPYRGLQAFEEEDAPYFFGRDSDIQRLIEQLKATRFLAVLGPSGTGKSSVVRAGLVPALRSGRLPGSERWPIRVLKPGARPLTELAAHLADLGSSQSMRHIVDDLRADRRELDLQTSRALLKVPSDARLVWVVDQFEEVFTLCRDEQERAAFIDNLLFAASVPNGRAVVVLTMRADFYARCAAHPELAARIAANQYLVAPMERDALRQAIEEPARMVGLEFESGLVATILDDVLDEPGSLPLLEHALLELWERRRGQMLTLEGYRESGGVQGAIAKRAESVYRDLDPERQEIARRVLLRLTQPGEGTEDTRRRVSMSELGVDSSRGAVTEPVVSALIDTRLLTARLDEAAGERQVEVSHEALIRAWPRLRQWIDEDRAGLREHRRLTEAALEWERMSRDEGALYRGARLALALEWRARNESALNDLERDFLRASEALRQRERDAARRRTRLTVLGLAGALLFISLVAVVALVQRNAAREESDRRAAAEATARAERDSADAARREALSRELAASALSVQRSDPQLSLLLAVEAVRAAQTSEAVEALRQTLVGTPVRSIKREDGGPMLPIVRLSPDNRVLVTARPGGLIELWDPRSGQRLGELAGHDDWLQAITFSADGKLLATGSEDGTARVWDVAARRQVVELRGLQGIVMGVSFSPDGKRILTAGSSGIARIWEIETGRQIAGIRAGDEPVTTALFSPDGAMIATAVRGGTTVRLWEASSGRQLGELRGHEDEIYFAAFSPDSRRLATTSLDNTARIWDPQTGTELKKLPSDYRYASVVPVAPTFSPDGRLLAVIEYHGPITIYDVATGQRVVALIGHQGHVNTTTFSPDGRLLLSGSGDGSARIWDVSKGALLAELRGHHSEVLTANFSADGHSILTASWDDSAHLYEFSALDAPAASLPALAQARITRELTPEERDKYLHQSR